MQSGTAVLISKALVLPEIAEVTAVPVDSYNINQMSRGLFELSSEHGLTKQCQESGALGSVDFGWQRCANENLSIYKKVL